MIFIQIIAQKNSDNLALKVAKKLKYHIQLLFID